MAESKSLNDFIIKKDPPKRKPVNCSERVHDELADMAGNHNLSLCATIESLMAFYKHEHNLK